MNVIASVEGRILHLSLDGEIDEHSAKAARIQADGLIERHSSCLAVVFNLQKVTFMDSTGIGFLIGRYKKIKGLGMDSYISAPNAAADKILLMSGVYTLIPKINASGAGGVR